MSSDSSVEKTIVLYDSCVLYPAPLRDLLMWLALAELFRAKWTDAIHDEWIRSVLADRPDLTLDKLDRTRQLMNARAPDSLVTGYEQKIDQLVLPDPDDRHVLAAAIEAKADLIVTFNLKDFPPPALSPYQIRAQDPDDFICDLIDQSPKTVLEAVRDHHESLQRPRKTKEQYLGTLIKQRLRRTVERLERLMSEPIEDSPD